MNKTAKTLIIAALITAVCGIIIYKHSQNTDSSLKKIQLTTNNIPQSSKSIPRLVDLGADKCIPCKMMAPMLEDLKTEYAGKLQVDFIDVWKNPEQSRIYGIKIIPTQIFFDASGKELFRHEGFYSKKDILAKWKELGIKLTKRN